MGTISQRKLADGTIRFRAEIRISRKGFANFKESKTFSSMRLAQKWLAMREEEIEENPDILLGRSDVTNITLANAIDKYLDEVGNEYGRTKTYCLRLIQKFPIAQYIITKIKPADISEHVALRKAGYAKLDLKPIATSTLQHELLHIRGVLSQAHAMWDVNVDLAGFDKATAQLRKTRQISSSAKRDRLPTTAELKKLTEYFYRKWQKPVYSYPMHLIMWFAIFSCRRESEITEMLLADYDEDNEVWKVRDLKNPNGSKGNHKEFNVLEPCRKMIELLQVKSTRKRMLNRGYDKDLLIPLSPKTIGGEFRNACKILGIEDLRFHDLRHEGCTRLAEQGFTIPQIQQVSLHDSWGSLERYVSVKKRKKAIELDEVLPLIGEE
ncbi:MULTISPECIES: site-specific integrase [Acinetobacter]|uniref:site-specific integrase n=1 Tax=Acinetobacter TaxID=469 RepID=UPI001902AC6A|nr:MULTISPECIES: tyrosine-type recombinase/integrase [Acinetobacter]MBJ8476838.1 tyrosine-type recombinase/integrase [Acinetobacter bereziniae]MCU4378835.1 tyrosine-type recombinase/integrase [Acinetobacter haemolyticus]